MKRYTSRFFKSVAWFYISFPLAYILLVAILFDIPVAGCVRILLSPLYYIVGALAVLTGYGLLEMKRWAWYWFLVTNALIVYETALWANDYGESHHQVLAFAAVALLVFYLILRVAREVRVPYFFPRIPWWESDPRYRFSVPARISFPRGEPVEGEILDLSLGGCFIKSRADIYQDEAVTVEFDALDQKLRYHGFVVWRTQSTVTHPKGVGVKFTDMDRKARRTLRVITSKLMRATALSRKQRHFVEEEEVREKKADPGTKQGVGS